MESIYNLVPREYVEPPKAKMHRSHHDPSQNLSGSTFGCFGTTRLPGAGIVDKRDGALFGPHKKLPNKHQESRLQKAASNSLNRSGSGEGTFTYTDTDTRKPGVPSRYEKPVMGITSSKNFVTANAVEAILMVPKTTQKPQLNYLEKEDYGQVPEYLGHVKEEVKRENEMIEQYINEQMGTTYQEPDRYEEMSEDEREELIYRLKIKWTEINTRYQRITHLVDLDTLGQVRRKEQLENALKNIEADIEKISRAGPLLIA
jgi:hypothetical protein